VPGTVYYSKLLEENIAPEFSAALVISLGRNRKLTGIGAIDDKIVVFSEREIFAIYDTGPDNTGANGDFVVDRLQTTVGCSDPQSVVEIPEGLFFYSNISKEFHLLSRDLQVHDIGKPVEDISEYILDIKSSVVFPGDHEVRWYVTLDDQYEYNKRDYAEDPFYTHPPNPAIPRTIESRQGYQPVLVYNYHYKKWCLHSNVLAAQATLFQNYPTYIDVYWNPYQASETVSDWELDTSNKLTVISPWIRMNQLQSFGRVEELTFLGKYLSSWQKFSGGTQAGDVQIKLHYDYQEYEDSNEDDSYRFRANQGALTGLNSATADRPAGRMQFDVTPGKQKVQAIKVEINELSTSAIAPHEGTYEVGRGFVISGMDIVYTPKSGTGSKTMHKGTSK